MELFVAICNCLNLNDHIIIQNFWRRQKIRSTAILVLLILSISFTYIGCKQAEEVVDKSEEMHEEARQEFNETISAKVAPEVWGLIQTENYKLRWKM